MKRKLISLLALVLLLTAVLASCGTFNFEKKDMQKYLKDFTVDAVNGIKVEATLPDYQKIVTEAVDAEIAATLLKNKFIRDELTEANGWTGDATLEKGDMAALSSGLSKNDKAKLRAILANKELMSKLKSASSPQEVMALLKGMN